MLVKKTMNTTDDPRLFEFFNNVLPKSILKNPRLTSNGIDIADTLEEEIGALWETYCNNNDYSRDPYPEFKFIYTTRLKLNRQKNLNSSIFFLRMPKTKVTNGDDAPISCAFLISDNGIMRFFGLKELSEDLLPARFIKTNQSYLLYELNENLEFTNWGKLINPRNFSELSESIFHIGGV